MKAILSLSTLVTAAILQPKSDKATLVFMLMKTTISSRFTSTFVGSLLLSTAIIADTKVSSSIEKFTFTTKKKSVRTTRIF